MPKSLSKLVISPDLSANISNNLGESSAHGKPELDTPGGSRPRKKLSFKEPESFGSLNIKKSSNKTKNSQINSLNDAMSQTLWNEKPFDEDDNYEELEVRRVYHEL